MSKEKLNYEGNDDTRRRRRISLKDPITGIATLFKNKWGPKKVRPVMVGRHTQGNNALTHFEKHFEVNALAATLGR